MIEQNDVDGNRTINGQRTWLDIEQQYREVVYMVLARASKKYSENLQEADGFRFDTLRKRMRNMKYLLIDLIEYLKENGRKTVKIDEFTVVISGGDMSMCNNDDKCCMEFVYSELARPYRMYAEESEQAKAMHLHGMSARLDLICEAFAQAMVFLGYRAP